MHGRLYKKLCLYLMPLAMIVWQNPVKAAAEIKEISPSLACNLLKDIGLPTTGWRTYYDNENGCSSRLKILSEGDPFRNFISYNVEGNGQIVRQIRLIVSILNPDESELAQTHFKKIAEFLIIKITSKPVPKSILRSIESGTDLVLKTNGLLLELKRKEWVMTTDWETLQCYDITLTIR